MEGNLTMTYKHQETFAHELSESWMNGNREHVRLTIRGLKNKAQAAYIAAAVALFINASSQDAAAFVAFIHPNN